MIIRNSSFVGGIAGWRPVNYASNVRAAVVADASARSAGHLLRVSTTRGGGSVAFDLNTNEAVTVSGWAGNQPISALGSFDELSFGALAWVRASPGSAASSGSLAMWQLPQPNQNTSARWNAGSDWSLVTCSHDFVSGGTTLRIEFYLDNPGRSLDIDSVLIF